MYRDRDFPCPHCGVPLVRYPARDKWRCRDCGGVLAGPEELPADVAVLAREPAGAVRGRTTPIDCPGCGSAMLRSRVADIDVERCDRDGYVWFDRGELGQLHAYLADERTQK